MRHRKRKGKLSRQDGPRRALLSSLASDLFKAERITTTPSKGRELVRLADHLISMAKDGSLHARRQAMGIMRSKEAVSKLFSSIGSRYMERKGGYTRMVKLGPRRGDNAPQAIVELVERMETEAPRKKKKKA